MSRYTEYYLLLKKEDLDEEKFKRTKQDIKMYEELYDNTFILVAEKWRLRQVSKILFGEDYEVEKYYREYNVYAKHIVSIIKATRSVYNTNYYRDTKKFQLTEILYKLLDILK